VEPLAVTERRAIERAIAVFQGNIALAAAALDLATSAKDLDEHRFAVESVLAALRAHGPGITSAELPFTLKLPNLWHLASDVHGRLSDGSGALDLVAALHPTAAVAGTPTRAALEVIRELEPFDRGRYGGPVGWGARRGGRSDCRSRKLKCRDFRLHRRRQSTHRHRHKQGGHHPKPRHPDRSGCAASARQPQFQRP